MWDFKLGCSYDEVCSCFFLLGLYKIEFVLDDGVVVFVVNDCWWGIKVIMKWIIVWL